MSPKKRKASPPKEHQFKKNTSGNPKGRPRGSGKKDQDVDSPLAKIGAMSFQLSINGSEHSISSEHLLEHKILEAAMRGENKAIRTVFGWIAQRDAYRAGKQARAKFKPITIVQEASPPENADRALELLDMIEIRKGRQTKVPVDMDESLKPWQQMPTELKPIPIVKEASPPRNADRALELSDMAEIRKEDDTKDLTNSYDRLKPWLVEAALSRRRGTRRLSKDRLDWLLSCTIDGKSVKIPRGYRYD